MIKTKKESVQIIGDKEMQNIISPLSEKALETLLEMLDRYVDYTMVETIKVRINSWDKPELDQEIKLRWVLEFRGFVANLFNNKWSQ